MFQELLENKSKIVKNVLDVNNKLIKEAKNTNIDITSITSELEQLEESKKNLIKLYSLNKIDDNEFEELNNEYKLNIANCKNKLVDIKNNRQLRNLEKNIKKIKDFLDFDKFEITSEFIHQKIRKIYVKQIKKNHVKLKINFHLDLEMSEVDKKSICLGLII